MDLSNSNGMPMVPSNIKTSGLSFADEKKLATKQSFGFTVTNTSGAQQKILINPSYIPSVTGRTITDGNIVYAAGKTDLACASTNDHTVAEFLEFIKFHPIRVMYLQIKSTLASQLDQELIIQPKSLFGNDQPIKLLLQSFLDPKNYNDKLIIVDREDWQLDYDTEVFINIPDGASTTFTFYLGAYVNQARHLRKAAQALK